MAPGCSGPLPPTTPGPNQPGPLAGGGDAVGERRRSHAARANSPAGCADGSSARSRELAASRRADLGQLEDPPNGLVPGMFVVDPSPRGLPQPVAQTRVVAQSLERPGQINGAAGITQEAGHLMFEQVVELTNPA